MNFQLLFPPKKIWGFILFVKALFPERHPALINEIPWKQLTPDLPGDIFNCIEKE